MRGWMIFGLGETTNMITVVMAFLVIAGLVAGCGTLHVGP